MFDTKSRLTSTESVVESANSGIESADSTADSAENPVKIGLWVRAFRDDAILRVLKPWHKVILLLDSLAMSVSMMMKSPDLG